MAGKTSNFGGKQAPPFGKSGSKKKVSTATLKKREAALEKTKRKTAAETRLEAEISRRTGKPYKGKR